VPPAIKPAPGKPATETAPRSKSAPEAAGAASALIAAEFAELPGWAADDHASALRAFLIGCQALEAREAWRTVCQAARKTGANNAAAARRFFETHFRAYRTLNADGSDEGLITGYYEPLLRGSRRQGGAFRTPLLARPDDMVAVELGQFREAWRGERVVGRVVDGALRPYESRAEIEAGALSGRARPIAWVDDPVDAFFLQIQGSGRVALAEGGEMRVGYAAQNGHGYVPVGRILAERGEIPRGWPGTRRRRRTS